MITKAELADLLEKFEAVARPVDTHYKNVVDVLLTQRDIHNVIKILEWLEWMRS